MAKVDTMPIYLRPLMRGCSVKLNRCAVCGETYPLNQHHVVRRSAGKMYDCHGSSFRNRPSPFAAAAIPEGATARPTRTSCTSDGSRLT